MSFSPPNGIAFHTVEEVEASDLCAVLRDVVAFLDTLQPQRRKLRLHDDWWRMTAFISNGERSNSATSSR